MSYCVVTQAEMDEDTFEMKTGGNHDFLFPWKHRHSLSLNNFFVHQYLG